VRGESLGRWVRFYAARVDGSVDWIQGRLVRLPGYLLVGSASAHVAIAASGLVVRGPRDGIPLPVVGSWVLVFDRRASVLWSGTFGMSLWLNGGMDGRIG
jgi:hypothetical protein